MLVVHFLVSLGFYRHLEINVMVLFLLQEIKRGLFQYLQGFLLRFICTSYHKQHNS